MADTELQGIFQGDVVVRTAIMRAMDLVRNDPTLLDHVFQSLAEDELTNDVYGKKQIAIARDWFMNTEVPVFMNFRVAEEYVPCITISLQESQEADQTHGDIHYIPQESTPGDWPVLAGPFTPVAYSPASGIMILPDDAMADLTVAAGMVIVTRNGNRHTIKQNLGDNEISLTPYTSDDFTDSNIVGVKDRYTTKVESVTFREVYQIGIHVLGEAVNLLYLHSIVQFMLLKYKQELLEKRGFERTVISSTDFRRNLEFDNEEVFSRFITITGYARHYWPKDVNPMIDVLATKLDIDPIDDAPGPDDDDVAIDDNGNPSGPDDMWGVIPVGD